MYKHVITFVLILAGILAGTPNPFVIYKVNTEQKVVALTFDDGPKKNISAKILSNLKKQNVPATFFLIGKHLSKYNYIVQNILTDGHEIGNHGYNHERLSKKSTKEIIQLIAKSQLAFHENLNMIPMYYRPPYGEYKKSQKKLLQIHFKTLITSLLDLDLFVVTYHVLN